MVYQEGFVAENRGQFEEKIYSLCHLFIPYFL
jgi:hypothetical protein